MTTRRDLLCGAAAAVPAAAMAGVASAAPADPDERLRLAVRELEAAMRARWPERTDVRVIDDSLETKGSPLVLVVAHKGGA